MSISTWSRLGGVVTAGALLFACATNASEPYTDDGTQGVATPAADEDAGPATNPYPSYDSGATSQDGGSGPAQDAGSTTQDAGGGNPDAGGNPQPQDAGNPQPQDSGGGGTVTTACDLSNPVQVAIYQYELSQQSSPSTCPCNTGECCYLLYCVKQ